jgi:CheY-like chemotaxis protein
MTCQIKPVVLIVEDNDEDFDAIERVIRRSGLADIVRAIRGDDGLAILRNYELHGRTAMVLLDLNTPGADGREVLREMKSDESLRTVPVVIFTTSSNPSDIEGCYRNGANSYHLKPLDLAGFEATVLQITEYWLNRVLLMNKKAG